jgi:hypothetical protein
MSCRLSSRIVEGLLCNNGRISVLRSWLEEVFHGPSWRSPGPGPNSMRSPGSAGKVFRTRPERSPGRGERGLPDAAREVSRIRWKGLPVRREGLRDPLRRSPGPPRRSPGSAEKVSRTRPERSPKRGQKGLPDAARKVSRTRPERSPGRGQRGLPDAAREVSRTRPERSPGRG